jgi:PAS domain-containing protein
MDCRELLDDLDAIVWEADPQTVLFSYVSQKAERLLGYPVQRWLDEPGFGSALFTPRIASGWSNLRRCGSGRPPPDARLPGAGGRRRVLWVRSVMHVTGDDHGRASRLTGVMLDISA